jgi:hypothetical protein
VGFKLEERKGLREGWDSKELWKSVESWLSLCLLEELDQLVHGHFNVAQDGTQASRAPAFRRSERGQQWLCCPGV